MSRAEAPLLSVLVPTHNYGRFISLALDSVLSQQVDGVEIVVVDDGSTDDTPEVLRPYAEAGSVRYVRQANSGPSVARNTAIQNSRAPLMMFLDADDLLLPGCIASTVAFMTKHPDAGLLFTNYDIFENEDVVHPSGVDTRKVFRVIPHEEVEPGEWLFTESIAPYIIRHGSFMHTSGLTVRRSVVDEAGLFRPGYFYGEDDEFFARVAHRCRAGYIDRVLARKRKHPASIIHDPTKRSRNTLHLLELTEIQLREYTEDDKLQEFLHQKVRKLATSHGWHLIDEGQRASAWCLLRHYIGRYPLHWPLYRLAARAALRSIVRWPNSSTQRSTS